MTLTELQVAALMDARANEQGIPVLLPCTLELCRHGYLELHRVEGKGSLAKLTAKGMNLLAAVNK